MENKKICFFISSVANAAGTERVCTEIANKLSQLGFIVTILSMYKGTPFFKLDGRIRLASVYHKKIFSKLVIPFTTVRIRQKLMTIDPDVLINVDSALFIYAAVAIAGLKIKNIVWEHFNYHSANNSIARIISRKLAARYSNIIITLTEADNTAWKNSNFCKAPVITIHNPSPATNKKICLEERKKIVLAVGRLHPQKGFDLLLDAWQTVNLTDTDEWQLHIIGSGELKQALEQKIESSGLSHSVRLIPATPLVAHHYQQASIYCLSSRYEGFPMVLLEAQAFGLPMVSFDCQTGPAEIIKHNETGLLVKNGDCRALAKAISLLMNDRNKRLTMGANAFQQAFNYHIDTIIKDWQRLFASI